jgi:RND family efflux transporter MFP subunit
MKHRIYLPCRRSRVRRRCVRGWFAAVALTAMAMLQLAAGQSSPADWVTVQLRAITPQLDSYAQVEPIGVLPVNAAETGVISGLNILPGTHVRAGQAMVQLSGPSIQTLLLQGEADVRSAKAQLDAARKSLAIQREQLGAHLATRENVHQAESALAQAQAALDNAQTRLDTVRQMRTVTAPADGMVLARNSVNGELVEAGQPVVTLETAGSLWLTAVYYGRDLAAIHVGMMGHFAPSDGGPALAVRVSAVFAAMTIGGGEKVAMRPLHEPGKWLSGESGKVTLEAPSHLLPVVPTRALILNQGRWWVMIHSAKGDRAQPVLPGPAEGWNTFIEHGLAPGAQVVVDNAYLLFHAQITEQYQIPD